ncbi:MAG TPA: ABC transporter ATP-binding protein [Streptosporangiaceae bacterium]
MNIVETTGLGKRYRRNWALWDCCLAMPEGRVAALVGPNGSGKTTLLNLTVGLIAPTTGRVTVLGAEPAGSSAARDDIAFVAQDAPLYGNVPVRDMLRMTCYLNRRWDQRRAEQRLADLGIPLRRKAGKLSGGQQAQLAMTLALARRPRLLVLDEPLSSLDPVSRHAFMSSVMSAVAEDGVSVILSSHILAELERVTNYLIILSDGQIQVAGDTEDLLGTHRLLTGPVSGQPLPPHWTVVESDGTSAQRQLLVRLTEPGQPVPDGFEARPVTLEELALAYLRQPGAGAFPGPLAARG